MSSSTNLSNFSLSLKANERNLSQFKERKIIGGVAQSMIFDKDLNKASKAIDSTSNLRGSISGVTSGG